MPLLALDNPSGQWASYAIQYMLVPSANGTVFIVLFSVMCVTLRASNIRRYITCQGYPLSFPLRVNS